MFLALHRKHETQANRIEKLQAPQCLRPHALKLCKLKLQLQALQNHLPEKKCILKAFHVVKSTIF